MRFNLLHSGAVAVIACTISAASFAAPIVVSETEFGPGSFSLQLIAGGVGGSASLTTTAAGNPGQAGLVSLTVDAGPPANGVGSWSWLACLSTQRVIDPGVDGAIAAIDASLDSAWVSGTLGPTVQSNAVIVRQGGRLYYAPLPLTSVGGWANASTRGVTASNFQEIINIGAQFLDVNSHPDFSAAGGPVEVGFARGNSNGGGGNFIGYTNVAAADNLRIAVHPCIAVTQQPLAASACTTGSAEFEVVASGDGTLSYQWQISDPSSPGGWRSLIDGDIALTGRSVGTFSGSGTDRGRWDGQYADGHNPGSWSASFRCVVSNSCGSVASVPADLRLCAADLNCSGFVDDADFVLFAGSYNALLCEDPVNTPMCVADLNGDTLVDDSDFVLFAVAYNELVCP